MKNQETTGDRVEKFGNVAGGILAIVILTEKVVEGGIWAVRRGQGWWKNRKANKSEAASEDSSDESSDDDKGKKKKGNKKED